MRILLQKVSRASVEVHGEIIGSIHEGYVLLLGVMGGDTSAHAQLLAEKITSLRLWPGSDGKINDRSLLDMSGSLLVISQFTLAGRTEKGNRPDYTAAAPRDEALVLYRYFIEKCRALGVACVEEGEFGANMSAELCNEGPVTLVLEK